MAREYVYIPPATGQRFHDARLGTYLYKGIRGVPGSGKTVVCIQDMFFKANMQPAVEDPKTGRMVRWSNWALVRQTFTALKESTIKTWMNWFPVGDMTEIHESPPIKGRFEVPSLRGDGTWVRMDLTFLAAEAPNYLNVLDGLELSGGYVNEAAQIEWEKMHKLQERIGRFKPPGGAAAGQKFLSFGVIMDTNTPLETSWWHRLEQVERPDRMLWFIQPPAMIKTKDGNGSVHYLRNDEENSKKYNTVGVAENVEHHNDGWDYYEKQLIGASEDYIRMRLLNEYGREKGGLPVYEETWNDRFHVATEKMQRMKGLRIGIGMDFGRNPAAVIGQITPMGQLRILDEVVAFNVSVPHFVETMLLPKLINEYGWPSSDVILFGDPAGVGKEQMSDLSPLGFLNEKVGIFSLIPPILQGKNNDEAIRINAVEKFLRGNCQGMPDFLLNAHCEYLRDGFNGDYHFKKKRISGNAETYHDKPDKDDPHSHIHDALQYLCCGMTTPNLAQMRRDPVGELNFRSIKINPGCI